MLVFYSEDEIETVQLVRNLQMELDKQGDKANKQAQKAVKDFSYWMHEKV